MGTVLSGQEAGGRVRPIRVTGSGYATVTAYNVYPDGQNKMPSGDATGRPIYMKLTDGTNDAVFDADDDDIAHAQTTLVVINLNYVHDGSKWVRMTQP